MAFSKMTKSKYPPRHWSLVGYPKDGKSTFAARMQGPFVVIDADQRFAEVLSLAQTDVYPVSDIPHEHTDPHAIAKRLRENMPGTRVGTIIVDSLTAIIAPRVVAAMVAKEAGEIKSLGAAFKDKALALRELQDAVTRWGVANLWIYHLHDARDDKGAAHTSATVSALELVRLTRSINMQLQVVRDGARRGIKIVWCRRGRDGMTLWDETGSWLGMPERIEQAVYDGLSEGDMERKELAAPEMFPSPEVALAWAIEQGAFESETHARNAYEKIKREQQPQNARHMAALWTADVERRKAEKTPAGACLRFSEPLAQENSANER